MNARLKLLLAGAAAAAAWSGWVVMERQAGTDDGIAEPVRSAARAPSREARRAEPVTVPVPALPGLRRVAVEGDAADAFASRDWAPAPPPPPPPPPVVAVQPPPPPPAAPPPPTLPYRFVGVAEAGLYTTPHVFLSLNDKLLIAKAGDALEGGYRLDAITPRELVFTHLQLDLQLRLSVQGAPS